MTREQITAQIAGYIFLVIDHKDEQIVVVMEEVENGYKGFALSEDNEGFTLNLFFIASTFIKANPAKRYEFTNDLDEAFDYLSVWNFTDI